MMTHDIKALLEDDENEKTYILASKVEELASRVMPWLNENDQSMFITKAR